MESGQETSILLPLKFMGVYNDETPPSEILNGYSKAKVERAFANVVRSQYQDRSEEKGNFIMNFGQYFRDCPLMLDFDFMQEPTFFFLRRVKNPYAIAMSAVIHNEVLIHKARKSPTDENFEEIRSFGHVLDLIQIHGSSGQDGLKFPPSFARLFKNSLTYAKSFPCTDLSLSTDTHREAKQPSTFTEDPPVDSLASTKEAPPAKTTVESDSIFPKSSFNWNDVPALTVDSTFTEDPPVDSLASTKEASPAETTASDSIFPKSSFNWNDVPALRDERSFLPNKKGEKGNKVINWNVIPGVTKQIGMPPSSSTHTATSRVVATSIAALEQSVFPIDEVNKNVIGDVGEENVSEDLKKSLVGDMDGLTSIAASEQSVSPTDEVNKNFIGDVDEDNVSEDISKSLVVNMDGLQDVDEFESNSLVGDVESSKNVEVKPDTVTSSLTEHVQMSSFASPPAAALPDVMLSFNSNKHDTVDLTGEDTDDDETLMNLIHSVQNAGPNFSPSTDDISKLNIPTATADVLFNDEADKLSSTSEDNMTSSADTPLVVDSNTTLFEPGNNVSSSTCHVTSVASGENTNTMSVDVPPKSRKLSYTKILSRNTKQILDLIDDEGLPPIWTESRASLIAYLAENDKLDLGNETLENLKHKAKNSANQFSVLEMCFDRWENQEFYQKNQTDYGTKKVVFSDVKPEVFLDTRNFKKARNCRSQKVSGTVAIYHCQGSNVCSNEECLFKKTYANDHLITEKRNTSHFLNVEKKGEIEIHCKYCNTDGYDSTIVHINCNARAYWKKGENVNNVYMMNEHTCCKKYRLNTPSSFEEDFKRKEGYVGAVKNNLRNQLQDNEITNVDSLYQNASEISVGSGKGPQAKIKAFGRPSPVKLRVQEIVSRLTKLDPNFILCNDEDCIITSSTRSLRKALHFDRTYGHFIEPGFIDVCFSRTRGEDRVACSIYFYEPVGCSVVKVANGYIPSENTESVSKVIRIVNEKIGDLIQVKDFRLKPRQMFVDYSEVNPAAFLAAGYSQEEINDMLEGCGKHFGDMVEQVKVHFKKNEKQIIETYIYDWKENIILGKSEHYFDTIKTFILRSIKDKEVADGLLIKLKWWKDRERCWSKAYSGLRHVDSNLSEVGHSPCLKFSSPDEAIIDDAVKDLYDNGRLIAHGNGSELAVGSGPDYAQIQKLLGVDLDSRLKQIEEEFENPTNSVNNENCGGYQSDEYESPARPTKRSSKSRIISGKKHCVRLQFSKVFKAAHTRSLKLNVSVREVITDTDTKKEIRVMASSTFGMYSKGETFSMSFESIPSCNCSQCVKKSRQEVCAPQIWLRQKLLGMDDNSRHLNQIQFPTETVKDILRSWIQPVIDNEQDLESLFLQKEGRHPPSDIKYYLERTSVHTTRRRCFGGCHPLYGKEINIPPGNLNICVEGGLKVPVGFPEAVPGPIYLCASKKCAYEDLPKRTNLTTSRAPPTVHIRDPLKNITPDEILRLETREDFVFNM